MIKNLELNDAVLLGFLISGDEAGGDMRIGTR